MRIGLYGGSFDPIHIGHLLVARAAFEELGLDRLFFIPSSNSPFKPDSKPLDSRWRARLIRVALEDCPEFEISEFEIKRGGISFSMNTLKHFANAFPEAMLFYLIGTDHLPTLPEWKDAKVLARLVRFAVIPRPNATNISLPSGFECVILKGFPIEISSSLIRARLRAGLPIRPFLLSSVAEIIEHYRLYSQKTNPPK